ncbi:MAG: MerR family transcriptional regulator [Verrucomicrobiales bacterium]|nr:MerR family transcriptional regulator [Verrucomicrobiales bacterium]
MKKTNGNRYRPHEFAKRSRVTVRTLHHYDHIGLLKPSEHTGVGFRLYRDDDFVRLQQIVTLKFIGFSLKEIKRLLERKGSGLSAALRAQRRTLEEKRRRLDSAIQAIAQAERIAAARSKPDLETFQKITQEIQMQTDHDVMKKYYNDEARQLIAERQHLWSPELQEETTKQWTALFQDIEAAASSGMDPASASAQALLERQNKLVEGFTGGHAAISEGLCKLWSDQANWPEAMKKQVFEPFAQQGITAAQGPAPSLLSPKADAFLKKAMAARERANPGAKTAKA